MPDAKWLEILKASGWQTAAISGASGVYLYLAHNNVIPKLPDMAVQLLFLAMLVCGMLAVGSLLSALFETFPVHIMIAGHMARENEKKSAAAYIPHMTPKEREIIGHLLARNQKVFTCTSDGGHARTLIARGIIRSALRAGMTYTIMDVPFCIPDHIWDVLAAHSGEFPGASSARPSRSGSGDPWRENIW